MAIVCLVADVFFLRADTIPIEAHNPFCVADLSQSTDCLIDQMGYFQVNHTSNCMRIIHMRTCKTNC